MNRDKFRRNSNDDFPEFDFQRLIEEEDPIFKRFLEDISPISDETLKNLTIRQQGSHTEIIRNHNGEIHVFSIGDPDEPTTVRHARHDRQTDSHDLETGINELALKKIARERERRFGGHDAYSGRIEAAELAEQELERDARKRKHDSEKNLRSKDSEDKKHRKTQKLRNEVGRVTTHYATESLTPDAEDAVPAGYEPFVVDNMLSESARNKGIEVPDEILVSQMLIQRLQRAGVDKTIRINTVNLATACERARIEHSGKVLIGSLDYEDDDEPEIEIGMLQSGEVIETIDQPPTAAEINVDPEPSFEDTEGIDDMNTALYTAILLLNRLSSPKGIERARKEVIKELNHTRFVRLFRSIGISATSGTLAFGGVYEVMPASARLVTSTSMLAGAVGNAVYGMIKRVPEIDKMTPQQIIDMMETDVEEDARKLAKDYPVISFETAVEF